MVPGLSWSQNPSTKDSGGYWLGCSNLDAQLLRKQFQSTSWKYPQILTNRKTVLLLHVRVYLAAVSTRICQSPGVVLAEFGGRLPLDVSWLSAGCHWAFGLWVVWFGAKSCFFPNRSNIFGKASNFRLVLFDSFKTWSVFHVWLYNYTQKFFDDFTWCFYRRPKQILPVILRRWGEDHWVVEFDLFNQIMVLKENNHAKNMKKPCAIQRNDNSLRQIFPKWYMFVFRCMDFLKMGHFAQHTRAVFVYRWRPRLARRHQQVVHWDGKCATGTSKQSVCLMRCRFYFKNMIKKMLFSDSFQAYLKRIYNTVWATQVWVLGCVWIHAFFQMGGQYSWMKKFQEVGRRSQ